MILTCKKFDLWFGKFPMICQSTLLKIMENQDLFYSILSMTKHQRQPIKDLANVKKTRACHNPHYFKPEPKRG